MEKLDNDCIPNREGFLQKIITVVEKGKMLVVKFNDWESQYPPSYATVVVKLARLKRSLDNFFSIHDIEFMD